MPNGIRAIYCQSARRIGQCCVVERVTMDATPPSRLLDRNDTGEKTDQKHAGHCARTGKRCNSLQNRRHSYSLALSVAVAVVQRHEVSARGERRESDSLK